MITILIIIEHNIIFIYLQETKELLFVTNI